MLDHPATDLPNAPSTNFWSAAPTETTSGPRRTL